MEKLRLKQCFSHGGVGESNKSTGSPQKSVKAWGSVCLSGVVLDKSSNPSKRQFSPSEFKEPAWRAGSRESFVPRELPRRQRLVELGHFSGPQGKNLLPVP